MKREYVLAIFFAFFFVVGWLAYEREQDRELYAECLRVTERLLEAEPKRYATPYCRL